MNEKIQLVNEANELELQRMLDKTDFAEWCLILRAIGVERTPETLRSAAQNICRRIIAIATEGPDACLAVSVGSCYMQASAKFFGDDSEPNEAVFSLGLELVVQRKHMCGFTPKAFKDEASET